MESYYDILGVEQKCKADEVKRAYRKLAMKWHPDKNGGCTDAEQRFKMLSEAYHVLSDSSKRPLYDQLGRHHGLLSTPAARCATSAVQNANNRRRNGNPCE
eukprot:scaffold537859_cov29-Prasinocladus_malaysianus.AAC.1